MFLFQYYIIGAYKRKVREYEKDCAEWLKGRPEYYSAEDYARGHSHPADFLVILLKVLLSGVLSLVVIFGIIAVVGSSNKASAEERKQAYAGHTCKAHDLGDHVKINYGTSEGATGTIVGGCGHDEDYQFKFDNGIMAYIENDGQDGKVDASGKIIGVDSYKNLTKIEKAKDAK